MNKPKVYKVLALYPDGELISPQIEATSYQGEREIILRYKEGERTHAQGSPGLRTWPSRELAIDEANKTKEKGAIIVVHEAAFLQETIILLGKEVWRKEGK